MREPGGPFIRTAADANRVAQLGMLRGAGLGAALALPLGVAGSLLGCWLEVSPEEPHPAWVLTIIVVVTGGFVGAVWTGQHDLMRDWPKKCRARIWAEWRRGLTVALPVGLPVAGLLGWLCWRELRLVSVALGAALEVLWLFAGVGALVGCHRGERSVRRFLEQAGYAHFGWFQYGTPVGKALANFSDSVSYHREIRPGGRPTGGQDHDQTTIL